MPDKEIHVPSEAEIREMGASALKSFGEAMASTAEQLRAAARDVAPGGNTGTVEGFGGSFGVAVLNGLGDILKSGAAIAGEVAGSVMPVAAVPVPEPAAPVRPVAPPVMPVAPVASAPEAAGSGTGMTLAIIKCGAVARGAKSAILQRVLANGLDILALREMRLSAREAMSFYGEHAGRPYFEGLIRSVSDEETPVTVMVLSGKDAVARWRAMLGATDPTKAQPGSIRADFGTQMPDNAAHGSDSAQSADQEIGLFFPALSA